MMCNDCNKIDLKNVIYNNCTESPSLLDCVLAIDNKTDAKTIVERIDEVLCQIYYPTVIPCFREKMDWEVEDRKTILQLLTAIQQQLCDGVDVKVKVTESDTETGYLNNKIDTETCIRKRIETDVDGVQKIIFYLDAQCLADTFPGLINVETPQCYNVECPDCNVTCTPAPLTPNIHHRIVNNITYVYCTNCNGMVQWYNSDGEVIGTGTEIVGSSLTSYTAKSHTYCGESIMSAVYTTPNTTYYTVTKTTQFTKNNCPTNGCGQNCVGSVITFSKVYTSYISQAHAQSLMDSDVAYPSEGQTYANTNGSCTCPTCGCTNPSFTDTSVSNSTCSGSGVLQSNGTVSINGISNTTKFGVVYNTTNYNGPNYSGAYTMGTTNGNITSDSTSIIIHGLDTQTKIVIRLFNAEDGCYKDVFVALAPANCSTNPIGFSTFNITCSI